jgi:glutamine amidotransferase-like uncharacterized protein
MTRWKSDCKFATIAVIAGVGLLRTYTPAIAAEAAGAKTIRVAIYADAGASKTGSPQLKASLPKEKGFELELVTAEQIRGGALDEFDVLIHPGGSGSKQGNTLGVEGREKVKKFVEGGGGFIGICAGAYLASAQYPWSLGLLDAQVVDTEHWARGTGEVKLKITREGKDALETDEELCPIYYGQGPLLAPAGKDDINDYELLASYETEIAKKGAPTGVMKGTTAIARAKYGKGRVQCFSPHPEKTPGLEPFVQAAVRWVAKTD